ncbi:S8 family serine peptidase [Herpetosiphon llansteffanensis]|uniref:S8 family serine peptidase n=1 Tax=Herpetosiphon llansteffanensis TaxID=2094568 RepID=UPI000D7CCD2B|nr:S8 family serine peptidase [Herpetosiphon llansteffanensis]
MKHRYTRLATVLALLTMLASNLSANNVTRAAEPLKPSVETATDSLQVNQSTANRSSKPTLAPLYGEFTKSGSVKVIVQFHEAPLATYAGEVNGLKATANAQTGRNQLDVKTAESQAYLQYLDAQHASFLNDVQAKSNQIKQIADYQVALNGMFLEVDVSAITVLRNHPDVASVSVDTIHKLDTDSSNQFIGTASFWQNLNGGPTGTNAGENIVIGVIDSGIYNPSSTVTSTGIHPSLRDPSPVGGDYSAWTGGYKGVCAPTPPANQIQDGSFGPCNDKLIGAWFYNGGNLANAGEMKSPMDQSGHGTHTATTAGGNGGTASPFGIVSGVAPRARIIAYKVCWERLPTVTDDGRCSGGDSISAINQALIDGVHVLNYSISGGEAPWTDPVEIAFRNANASGVIVSASAGNAGTVGSVGHDSPWLITVAASTQAREFKGYISNLSGGTGAAPTPLVGASLYPGSVTGQIKLAPPQGSETLNPSECRNPYAPGTFQATDIVICRRGNNARVLKYANVFAGGAGGGIIVNNLDNQGIVADYCAKVCVHLEKNATLESAAGEALVTYVQSGTVTGKADGGVKVNGSGDKMAGFSSMGPSPVKNLIKPDVTMIGVDVNAGHTAFVWDDAFVDGELFQVIGGTSMSSPHNAGLTALMRQKYSNWSPFEIKSALMTTAKTSVVKPDGVTPADPFNMGAGRVDPTKIFSAGLVLNETVENFVAADPDAGGNPATLNIASAANDACAIECTWTRTVKNTLNVATTWTVSGSTSPVTVTATPASLNLAPGATGTITIKANVAGRPINGNWIFGELRLTESANRAPAVHFPIAVKAMAGGIPSEASATTRRDSGKVTVGGYNAVNVTNLTIREFGLTKGLRVTEVITGDSTPDIIDDDLTDGVFLESFVVPAGASKFVAQITETTAEDIDLYVFRDANGDGIPQEDEAVGDSTSPGALETVTLPNPTAGTYVILVQNWQASVNAPDSITLEAYYIPTTNLGNWDVVGPANVSGSAPFSVDISWNEPALTAGDVWFGEFDLGTSASTPGDIGRTTFKLEVLEPELNVAVSDTTVDVGEYVTYTLTISNYASLADTFYVTNTLPVGLELDASSLPAGASYNAATRTITWSGSVVGADREYMFSDSRNGGVAFDNFDVSADPNTTAICAAIASVECDEEAPNLPLGNFRIRAYDVNYAAIKLWTNGMIQFNPASVQGTTGNYIAQNMPSSVIPNGLYAGLWTDLDLNGTGASDEGGGEYYALFVNGVNPNAPTVPYLAVEYEGAQQYDAPTSNLNFTNYARADGVESEFCTVYGTLTGNLTTFADGVSVGIENLDGTVGSSYYYSGDSSTSANVPTAGTTICTSVGTGEPGTLTLTYRARATQAGTLTNSFVYSSAADRNQANVDVAIEAVQAVFKMFLPLVSKS